MTENKSEIFKKPVHGPLGAQTLAAQVSPPEPIYDTPDMAPKELEAFIHEKGIVGQDRAVKTTALILYRHFCMNSPSVNLFCGPTGSGKTQIWRILAAEFPFIRIFDSSSLTNEGWRGSNKLSYHFRAMHPAIREKSILVFDEFDKLLEPKATTGMNVTETIQNELLKLFDHDILFYGPENNNDEPLTVNTRNVSVVLLGAFEKLLKSKSSVNVAVGFGAQQRGKNLTYADTEITLDDLLKHTEIRPEIAGRIDRIVSMDPLTVQDHYRILLKYVDSIKHRTGTNVTIDPFVLQQIAASAVNISLGARWAIHRVNAIIDDMVYDNPFETNYVYLATNERTVI